jgi:hypothetical protein
MTVWMDIPGDIINIKYFLFVIYVCNSVIRKPLEGKFYSGKPRQMKTWLAVVRKLATSNKMRIKSHHIIIVLLYSTFARLDGKQYLHHMGRCVC